jgi:YD repeat-containing protein
VFGTIALACPTPHSSPAGSSSCGCDPNFFEANGFCGGGKNNGCPDGKCPPFVGNPVNTANGNKIERQLVYRGLRGFEFALTFNTFDYSGSRFSAQWRDSFDRRVAMDGASAMVYRANGQVFKFVASGGNWGTDADTSDHLVELKDAGGVRTGWQVTSVNGDEVETFDASGRLVTIVSREQLTQTLTYSDGTSGANGGVVLDANGNPTATVLPAGLLIRATDHFGRLLAFGYNASSRTIKMTDPAGGIYRFGYVNGDKLASITFPDTKVRTYLYNEPTYTGGANLPRVLTGIVDENNSRFATFSYDAQERALSTEHAGGAERYTMSYAAGATAVTNVFGAQRIYANTTVLGAFKNTGITGAVCPECGAASQTFDANGNISTRIDWNGNRTNYQYDLARNLETQRVEGLTSAGSTTAQTRTISTQWDATFRLPTAVAEPLRITTNSYDADGSQCGARGALCSRTVQATSDATGA